MQRQRFSCLYGEVIIAMQHFSAFYLNKKILNIMLKRIGFYIRESEREKRREEREREEIDR